MVLSRCNVSSPVTGAARLNIMEMLDNWESCPDEMLGGCLLCDRCSGA
jgi:hypothetical protein